MSDKKSKQLGMNPSTASGRLVKDLLWNFIKTTGQDACCKCGEPMSRETFSIEHVTPWLDSEDPVGLFFDVGNIGYSHLRCNVNDRRPVLSSALCGTRAKYKTGCKCLPCTAANRDYQADRYDPTIRQIRYNATGS